MPRPKGTTKAGARREKIPGFRTTKRAAERIRWNAKMYAGGNLSRWLEYAALEAPPRVLK